MLELKKEKIKSYLDQLEEHSEEFYEIRSEIFQLKREEVRRNIKNVKDDLEGEAILVFIGEFSSGKSTFINALIGKELLPTASRPCTSTITEIQFNDDGGGHKGKIHRLNGEKTEELPFDEILQIIDGGTSHISNFSSIHHVELNYDISMDSEENELLKAYAKNNIKIIDTPGFNSPYGLNEKLVLEYIEKSKYSFWFLPIDKIGGTSSRKILLEIKRKGIEILPIITKSDLISTEERGDIRESFIDELSDCFVLREPRFVSSFKIKEANDLNKKTSKANEDEIREKIEKLNVESGMYKVAQDLNIISTNKVMKSKRIELALDNLKPILNQVISDTQKEASYWKVQLEKNGWTEDNNNNNKVDKITNELKRWSNKQIKSISEEFGNELSDRVINLIRSKRGKTSIQFEINNVINQVTLDYLNPKLENIRINILEKYKSEADLDLGYKLDLKAPSLFNVQDVTAPLLGVMEALKYQGPNSLIIGGTGSILISSIGVLGNVPLVGATLSSVVGVVGSGLIGLALIPLIPVIIDKKRERAKKGEIEIKSKIKGWLREIKVESDLKRAIDSYIDELDKLMKDEMLDEIDTDLKNYNKVNNIRNMLSEINDEFKIVF